MRKLILVAAMVLVSTAGAQAGQSRSLSLAGSDRAAQETTAVVPASAVDTRRAPMSAKAAELTGATETSKMIDKPKYTERPPGVDMSMSRPSRMKAAASQRRAPPQMARADMRRPRHKHWSTARIVATLHRYGIYW
jgi:hypothetical protein